MMDPVEQIKERLPIYDLVAQYVELKKAGRNYKGLCPFHSEKSPSFVVSPEKGLAYCFGCNQGGDVFKFYQLVEGAEFTEALKALADRTNVELKNAPTKEQIVQTKSTKQKLIKLHDLASQIFVDNLWSEKGELVKQYLLKRGLTEQIIKKFTLGYAVDDRNQFLNQASKAGYSNSEMLESGLLAAKDTSARDVYDRFRQRLMIPISNIKGEVVAFGGRALAKDAQPKYLNSPETAIYHKSDILYGIGRAKEAMRKAGVVYIVEGYFDVIALHAAGYENVVATCGTALTERQVKLLKRFVDKVVFAFDADKAGQAALIRGAEIALRSDLNVLALLWTGGKDPADLMKQDVNLLKDLIENTKIDLLEYVWKIDFADKKASEIESPGFVAEILQKYLPLLNAIDSAVKKDLFIRRLGQFLRTDPRFIYDELKSLKKANMHKAPSIKAEPAFAKVERFDQSITKEEFFWGYLLSDLTVLEEIGEELKKTEVVFELNAVYKQVLDFYNSARDLNDFDLKHERLAKVALYLEAKGVDSWSKEQILRELRLLLSRLVTDKREHRIASLVSGIAQAERDNNIELRDKLNKEYNDFLSVN